MYRTGVNFGEMVDEATKDRGDSSEYLTLVNDDHDEGHVAADDADYNAMIPSGDDDLARIVLNQLPSGLVSAGQVRLSLSDSSSIRIIDNSGNMIYDGASSYAAWLRDTPLRGFALAAYRPPPARAGAWQIRQRRHLSRYSGRRRGRRPGEGSAQLGY